MKLSILIRRKNNDNINNEKGLKINEDQKNMYKKNENFCNSKVIMLRRETFSEREIFIKYRFWALSLVENMLVCLGNVYFATKYVAKAVVLQEYLKIGSKPPTESTIISLFLPHNIILSINSSFERVYFN